MTTIRDLIGLWLVRLGARVMTDRAAARLLDAAGRDRHHLT